MQFIGVPNTDIDILVMQTRNRLGLSQELFARLLGTTTSAVRQWENRRSIPKNLQADILHITNKNIAKIDAIEKTNKMKIGEILKPIIIGKGMSFAMYQYLKILYT